MNNKMIFHCNGSFCSCYFFYGLLIIANFRLNWVHASPDAERLYIYLMKEYSRLIRPVDSNDEAVQLQLQLQFMQLISVEEVKQVITTNVIVRQTWKDNKLKWRPQDFGGIEAINIPSENVWLPDMVLYNNAEGDYQITQMTKLYVNYTGTVQWDPPAIFKSYCAMNVRYFPFDKQTCTMKCLCLLVETGLMDAGFLIFFISKAAFTFTSWTYDATLVNLMPSRGYVADNAVIPVGMDLSEYKPSIEWDILEASLVRTREIYPYGPWVYITYTLVIRRKTLFYTVNLVIPCVLISFLTVFVFYLPCDSGEKVTLCISILLSLTVFILLLAAIIPPTSLDVPLLGRYLLFTMIMSTLSIALTVIVINVHYRNPSTHVMPPWFRKIFLGWLPKLLFIERPVEFQTHGPLQDMRNNYPSSPTNGNIVAPFPSQGTPSQPDASEFASGLRKIRQSKDVKDAVNGVNFILEHMNEKRKFANTIRDWKYAASVLDRLFFWIFAAVCLVGTGNIILDAPRLYEAAEPIPRLCRDPLVEDPWICMFKTYED